VHPVSIADLSVPRLPGAAAPVLPERVPLLGRMALLLLFSLLLLDGFPPGMAVLREFGARPINFPLAVAGLLLLLKALPRWRAVRFSHGQILFGTLIALSVSALNLTVALTRSGPDSATVINLWLRQFLMLCWGVASFFIWKRLLASVDRATYARLITVAAVPPVLAFFVEFAAPSGPLYPFLQFLREKHDLRTSGLAAEPSTYTAWVSFAWPIVLLHARHARSGLARSGAWLLLCMLAASLYLSHARTGVVIFILQLAYYGHWVMRRERTFGSGLRSALLLSFTAAIALAVLWQRLTSLTDVEENGSNIARFAYTITGINLFVSHLWLGTGVGQFGYFFASYVPDFALASAEVAGYAYGLQEFRASTFNLFVRLLCEFGLPLGLLFAALVIRPIVRAARSTANDPFVFYAALSAVGGVGFWLSQDQYGYQPAILPLAMLSLALARSKTAQAAGHSVAPMASGQPQV
jgi:hypothetical protein